MNNNERLNAKYSELCSAVVNELNQKYFRFVNNYEDLFFKDKFLLSIKDSNEMTIKELNNLFLKLYEVDSKAAYLLVIKRIEDYIKNNLILLKTKSMNDILKPINYDEIITFIKNGIKKTINDQKIPFEFDYALEYKESTNNNDDDKSGDKGVLYFNEDKFEDLTNDVLKRLSVFEIMLDSYELLSVQQISFTPNKYEALKSAVQLVKNSRLIKIDIDKIGKIILKNDTNDFDDIFSENYITYGATILESAYFVANYMCSKNKEKTTNAFHKNLTGYARNISENIDLYFDKLTTIPQIDFFDLYINLHNECKLYTEETILNEYRPK